MLGKVGVRESEGGRFRKWKILLRKGVRREGVKLEEKAAGRTE